MSLVLGTLTNDQSKLVTIHPEGTLHHTLIVGQSGSGKSFFVARLLEELLTRTRARLVIVDPNGDFRNFHMISNTVWDAQGARFEVIRQLCAGSGAPSDLDHKTEFSQRWSSRRFVALGAPRSAEGERDLPDQPIINTSTLPRVIPRRLIIHWADLEDERQFLLLRSDGPVEPKVLLGIKACLSNVSWRIAEYPNAEGDDLRALIKASEYFADRNVSLKEYRYAKNLDVDDWYAVRARFIDILDNYLLWWSPYGRPEGAPRPTGLCEFLDMPFRSGPNCVDWNALTIGLDAAREEDSLLAVDVALWRLWKNAKNAWHSRVEGQHEIEVDSRVPTFIVIDEAHNFAPGATTNPLRRRVTERILRIASEGRKYGLYLILATQRPTKLHPELVPECENSCVLRVQSAREQEFASSVLGIESRQTSNASQFRTGQGLLAGRWVDSPVAIDALMAPARTVVGGGSLSDSWMNPPETSEELVSVEALREDAREALLRILSCSSNAVTLVDLANVIVYDDRFASIGPKANWMSTGSFKRFLMALEIPGLHVANTPPPGYAYIEGVGEPPALTPATTFDNADLRTVAERIHVETGAPLLSEREYRNLFGAISEAVQGQPFDRAAVSAEVRDRLRERGTPIGRAPISFVLKGIHLAGHSFDGDVPQDPTTLSRAFCNNLLTMLGQDNVVLADGEREALFAWLGTDRGEPAISGDHAVVASEIGTGAGSDESDA